MDELPVLWVAMEARRRALNLRPTVLHHEKTRAKIKRGELVREEVYDNLDRMLKWVPGDASRAHRQKIPPRPIEGTQDVAAAQRARKLALVGTLSRAAALAADSPDDVPEEALADAERKAQEILKLLEREKSGNNGRK